MLKAVFCIGSDAKATNVGCLEVMWRKTESIWGANTQIGAGQAVSVEWVKRLSQFLHCPSWHDAYMFWERRYQRELGFQPYLKKLRAKMLREKQTETGVLNRTCSAWSRPMMQLIMDGWREECKNGDKALETLGKYMLLCMELKPSHVFTAWKKWAIAERHSRAADDRDGILRKLEQLKIDVKDATVRVSQKSATVQKAKSVNKKIQEELDTKLLILNMPARQPPTLRKIYKKFSKTLSVLKRFADDTNGEAVKDTLLLKPWTMRLGPAFKYTDDLDKTKVIAHPDFDESLKEAKDWTVGEGGEEQIEKWAPGKMKGAEEKTTAFRPGGVKAGGVILRWIRSMVKGAWGRQGKPADGALLEALGGGGWVDIEGAGGVELLKLVWLQCSNLHEKLSEKETIQMHEDRGGIGENSSIESLEDDAYIGFHSENPHVNDARGWIDVVQRSHDLQAGLVDRFRYVDQKDFTCDVEPESKKKRKIREAHLGQAQKRVADSGIVINLFSKYCGFRVPVVDSEVQKR